MGHLYQMNRKQKTLSIFICPKSEESSALLYIMKVSLPITEVIQRNFPVLNKEYESFALEKDSCRSCELYDHYKQVIQSEGCVISPNFMFIGEAGGSDEAEQNRPFIGMAGQRIREEMKKFPLIFNKKTTLISNVVSCRPLNNKFPDKDVAKSCMAKWLDKEIKIVQPKIIIVLGNQPLLYVREEQGITSLRGTWKFLPKYKIWSFATYHPSYVIRQERAKNKEVVDLFIQDIETIVKTWESKISDRTSP